MAAVLWTVQRIDPARVAIPLMSEVLVRPVSAAVLAHEALRPWEIAGGALVLFAGLLEIWPSKTAV